MIRILWVTFTKTCGATYVDPSFAIEAYLSSGTRASAPCEIASDICDRIALALAVEMTGPKVDSCVLGSARFNAWEETVRGM